MSEIALYLAKYKAIFHEKLFEINKISVLIFVILKLF